MFIKEQYKQRVTPTALVGQTLSFQALHRFESEKEKTGRAGTKPPIQWAREQC